MTNLEKAVDRLLQIEGFISNVDYDPGGYTFEGISREYAPDWEGWKYVDKGDYKKASELVLKFYKERFWEPLKCSKIKSFEVAFNIFQIGVNRGIKHTIEDVQIACNLLGSNLVVDGIIGPKTLEAVNSHNPVRFIEVFLGLQAKFYIEQAMEKDWAKKFLIGWLRKRVYERIKEIYD